LQFTRATASKPFTRKNLVDVTQQAKSKTELFIKSRNLKLLFKNSTYFETVQQHFKRQLNFLHHLYAMQNR